jgi:putative ABC transport system permease protein
MSLTGLAAKNLKRNKLRTILTALGVALGLLVFIILRTVLDSWGAAVEYAAKDRLGTRHKVTFIMPLDKTYVDKMRAPDGGGKFGITKVTWANWFGGKDPNDKSSFFATIAVDHETFLDVYDEISISKETADCWKNTLNGAIIGSALAKQKKGKWTVGQEVTLEGSIFPGDWKFTICGVYETSRRSVDKATFWFRWDYLNKYNEEKGKHWANKVGWIVSKIDDPDKSAEISKQIDGMFESYPDQTLSMSEKALNQSFMGMFSAILFGMDVVSMIILAIMGLILGNTIAMSVRERTNEYGVLRAVGFLPRHLVQLILTESLVTGVLGGALGLLFGIGLVNGGLSPFIEENMGGMFPYFQVTTKTTILVVVLSCLLSTAAALIPAFRASRIKPVDAIRQVG